MKHITLKEMLEEIIHSIVQKEEIKDYYYKNDAGGYKKITSVDLEEDLEKATILTHEQHEQNCYKIDTN